MLLRFETRARQRRLILRIEAKFRTFWPPVKIRGGAICEIFPCYFLATPIGPNDWYTFDGAPLRRLAATSVRDKKSSEVKYKCLTDYRRSGLNKFSLRKLADKGRHARDIATRQNRKQTVSHLRIFHILFVSWTLRTIFRPSIVCWIITYTEQ